MVRTTVLRKVEGDSSTAIRDPRRYPATITAEQLSQLLGVSSWSIYNSVKDGSCPLPPIRVGRRIVFSRSGAERLLQVSLEPEPAA